MENLKRFTCTVFDKRGELGRSMYSDCNGDWVRLDHVERLIKQNLRNIKADALEEAAASGKFSMHEVSILNSMARKIRSGRGDK